VVSLFRTAGRDRARPLCHRARGEGLPISGDKLPLVVVANGRGGSLVNFHDTAETLADAGFIDPERIGIFGFSRGRSLLEESIESLLSGLLFKVFRPS
jgi:predicted dienelactone hydrolase